MTTPEIVVSHVVLQNTADEVTVAQLREARKQLELDLQGAIAPLLRAFAETTGVHVDAVDVKMQTLWRLGAPRQHVVIGVRATLDL